jgi:hypothetical protein
MKKAVTLLALSLLTTAGLVAADSTILELEFPPPKITGTPSPVRPANLESPTAQPPQISIPANVTNLAKDKEVTSSDPWPIIGDLFCVTDGDKESEDGYFVELGEGPQWVQIDLEIPSTIYGIGLWHYHSQIRSYNDVIVQVSNDAEFKSGVTTIYNNDHDNSSELGMGKDSAYLERNLGRLIDAKRTTGRYVRLYSNGNTSDGLNHYVEVEVFGHVAE